MNFDIDKDWFAKKAAEEGDLEIGAGGRKTMTVNLTPEEIALLERLVDPAKADMRARIAALEAENQDLRTGSYLVSVIEERERLRKALNPFARIADMEEKTPAMTSVMVNVDLCRNARGALGKVDHDQP